MRVTCALAISFRVSSTASKSVWQGRGGVRRGRRRRRMMDVDDDDHDDGGGGDDVDDAAWLAAVAWAVE
jgi:hypothetical protein